MRAPKQLRRGRARGEPGKSRYWQTARVTWVSVRHSLSSGLPPDSSALAEQLRVVSTSRLLPSLNPLLWQSLSAPALQSGAPLAASGHTARPLTPGDFASRASASAASSRVSFGLFSVGSSDPGFSSNFPISLMRPGFSFGAERSGGGG